MGMRTYGFGVVLGVLLLPTATLASDAPPVQQASMLVSGTIGVDPHGAVTAYTLQDADKLPPAVVQLIKESVPAWRFKPGVSGGVALSASTGMSLRIVANIADAQHATISLAGEYFGCPSGMSTKRSPMICPVGQYPSYRVVNPPTYPVAAARSGIEGKVFLVLQIGADGHVLQSAVRQVDLYTKKFFPASSRALLAHAALDAASKWTFNVPTRGAAAAAGKWDVNVPVTFDLERPLQLPGDLNYVRPKHSLWRAYFSGPISPIPWVDRATKAPPGMRGDAIAGNGLFMADPRFVLLTPPTQAAPGA